MDADNKSGMIMIGILYLVIAFGVFGTVLMMTAERKRNSELWCQLGCRRSKLAHVMVYEMIYIGLLGILAGIAVALPCNHVWILSSNKVFRETGQNVWKIIGFEPVMAFQWIDKYFLWQSAVVGIIVLIAVLYPVSKIFKLKKVNALRHNFKITI